MPTEISTTVGRLHLRIACSSLGGLVTGAGGRRRPTAILENRPLLSQLEKGRSRVKPSRQDRGGCSLGLSAIAQKKGPHARPKFWEETSKKHDASQSTGVCAAPHKSKDSRSQREIQMTNSQKLRLRTARAAQDKGKLAQPNDLHCVNMPQQGETAPQACEKRRGCGQPLLGAGFHSQVVARCRYCDAVPWPDVLCASAVFFATPRQACSGPLRPLVYKLG